MKFEISKKKFDKIPIVMVDYSGSTSCVFDKLSILEQELKLVKQYFESKKIEQIYLMFWNDKYKIYSIEPTNISLIDKIKIKSCGGTTLINSLKAIPEEWILNKKYIDLFIYTDGEIGDNEVELSEQFNILFKKNVRIYINTVENNSANYLKSECGAGNRIFETIRKQNLTFKVKSFVSYNKYHLDEPFVSFLNPDVGPELAPFRDKLFRIDKTFEFIEWIEDIIKNTNTNEDIIKLALDLSLTLHYLIKNKSLLVQNQIINMLSELFNEKKECYKEIRKLFIQEINNHSNGQSSTFHTYKKNREKVFEKAQLSLFDNTKESLEMVPSERWVSFIINCDFLNTKQQYIVNSPEINVSETVKLFDKTYKYSGVKINDYVIPMIPSNILMDNDIKDQCIRQWIRANYSKKNKLNPASDFIQYYFLIDAMKVLLSDVSIDIKLSYKQMCMIMLDRKRFGTDIKEYEYLLSNAPSPVSSSNEEQMTFILENARINSKIEKVKPMTLWFCFLCAMDDDVLINAQYPYCQKDLCDDKLCTKLPSKNKIIKFIKNKFVPIKEYNLETVNKCNFEYCCYITLDDTSETGGYLIPKHKIGTKIICKPKFILSKEGYNYLCENGTTTKCPICCINLNLSDFEQIESEKKYMEKINSNQSQTLNIYEPIYNTKLFEKITIGKNMYSKENLNDFELKKLNDCDFEVNSFIIDSPIFKEAISSRTIEIRKQDEFNNCVNKRYPFLSKMNWDGVCLAGGFCRSILLRQKLKDFDFFFFGKQNMKTFTNFLSNLMAEIKNTDKNVKFLILYKHQFNVFEVVCINDPNNFFTSNYKLDNFKQYDFKSLHKFDKYTVIDPETCKVYRKKKYNIVEILDLAVDNIKKFKPMKMNEIKHTIENVDFSNYFEDGDINGVRMKYRFQFILLNNDTISDLFSKFDMYPCRVAWDGKTTWFTNKSEFAYKYMINIVNTHNYSSLLSHRLSKYFTYGFNIVMPDLNFNKIENDIKNNMNIFKIEDLVFNIIDQNDNQITVEHNSHIADKIDSIEKLEQKNIKDGKVIYKSSLFCSLVSLLRYVKINNISYKFTKDVLVPNVQNTFEFRESNEEIKFIDLIDSRIIGYDWYGKYKIDDNDDNNTIVNNYKIRLENLKNNKNISDKNYSIICKNIKKMNFVKVEKDLKLIENHSMISK